jgi:hypothetical protein
MSATHNGMALSAVHVDALRLLCPDGQIELRALSQEKRMSVRRFNDHAEALRWAEQQIPAKAVYVLMTRSILRAAKGGFVADDDKLKEFRENNIRLTQQVEALTKERDDFKTRFEGLDPASVGPTSLGWRNWIRRSRSSVSPHSKLNSPMPGAAWTPPC